MPISLLQMKKFLNEQPYPKVMKFLLDVNASGALLSVLIKLGHDVICVRDVNPEMDDDIIAWAVRENRIIITTDNDFE